MGKDKKPITGNKPTKSAKARFDRLLILSTLFFIIAALTLLGIHLIAPGESETISTFNYSKSDLGTIGDFVGGSLNPLLTFFTVILLVRSLLVQQDELKQAINQLKESSRIHEETLRETKANYLFEKTSQKYQKAFDDFMRSQKTSLGKIENPHDYGPKELEISLYNLLTINEKLFERLKTGKETEQLLIQMLGIMHFSTQGFYDVYSYAKQYAELGLNNILFEREFSSAHRVFKQSHTLLTNLQKRLSTNEPFSEYMFQGMIDFSFTKSVIDMSTELLEEISPIPNPD